MISKSFDISRADSLVRITLTENNGDIDVRAQVLDDLGDIADLRGVFFNISDDSLVSGLSVQGADITDSKLDANNVDNLGGGVNINGDVKNDVGAMDGGVEIGTSGIGSDDIRDTTFTISHNGQSLSLSDFDEQAFAVRLTSVGPENSSRDDSIKMYSIFDADPAAADATPVANDDSAETVETIAVTVDVLDNDTHADGDDLTVTSASVSVQEGTVTVDGNNNLVFTPATDFVGEATITYTVEDETGDTDTATVSVTVTADPVPTASDDNASTDENTPVIIDVTTNDTHPDNDDLTITGVSDPDNGQVQVNGDGTITFTPDADFSGATSFTYTIEDETGDTDTATVSVTVAADPVPTASDDSASTDENTPVIIDVTTNDTHPDNDDLTITGVSDPDNGQVQVNGDGTITFTPDADFSGATNFTYTIEDETGDTDTATVSVTVTADPVPTASDDSASTDENTPVIIDVTTNDTHPDNDDLTITGVSDPDNGQVQINGDGTITFTPDADFSGATSFTYTIEDETGDTDTATVSVTVNKDNTPPDATTDTALVRPGEPTAIDVISADNGNGLDSDADGDALTLVSIEDPANPGTQIPFVANTAVTLASGTTVTFGPSASDPLTVEQVPGADGVEIFNYTISDGTSTDEARVILMTDTDGDGIANFDDIDDDNDGILDVEECGEAPTNVLVNPSFEDPLLTDANSSNVTVVDGSYRYAFRTEDLVPGWETSATDNKIEIWRNNSGSAASNGEQFVELNAHQISTLSQTVAVTEGQILRWSFDQMAREGAGGVIDNSTINSLNFSIGDNLGGTEDYGTFQAYEGAFTTHSGIYIVPEGVTEITFAYASLGGTGGNNTLGNFLDNITLASTITCDKDSDGDGIADSLDIDKDNDGITDNVEAQTTAGYIAPSGIDTDGDGLDDAYDANVGDISSAGSIGLSQVDTDADGTFDTLDTDADDDGIADVAERGDGAPTAIPHVLQDTDGDGLLDVFEGSNVDDGFDVNDENISGDDGGLDGQYTKFALSDEDADTNANEDQPGRSDNDATPLNADLDWRDEAAASPITEDVWFHSVPCEPDTLQGLDTKWTVYNGSGKLKLEVKIPIEALFGDNDLHRFDEVDISYYEQLFADLGATSLHKVNVRLKDKKIFIRIVAKDVPLTADQIAALPDEVGTPVSVADAYGNTRWINLCVGIDETKVNSPIVFDLNGDNEIGVTGPSTAKDRIDDTVGDGVLFDIDADGTMDRIEWLAGDGDAFLVDNSDGRASLSMDGARLFGDQGGMYTNGYEKLELWDDNSDGQLTGTELEGLALWADDGDAVVEAGELHSVQAHGVESIAVNFSNVTNDAGETLMRSTFEWGPNGQNIPATDGVDLVVAHMSVRDASLAIGQKLHVDLDVANLGNVDASSTKTTLYWNATEVFDRDTAIELNVDSHGTLTAGELDTNERMRVKYADIAPLGTGYVFGVIDADGQISELDETNNVSNGVRVEIDGGAQRSDLSITSATARDASLNDGQKLIIDLEVTNQGTVAARGAETTLYWSQTDSFDFATAVALAADGHGNLKAGETDTNERIVVKHADIAANGDGFVFAVIDAGNAHLESDETNNVSQGIAVSMVSPDDVDLAILEMTAGETSLADGDRTKVHLNLENQGQADASSAGSILYWSETDTFDFNTAAQIDATSHGTVKAGDMEDDSFRLRHRDLEDLGSGWVFAHITSEQTDQDLSDNLSEGIFIEIL